MMDLTLLITLFSGLLLGGILATLYSRSSLNKQRIKFLEETKKESKNIIEQAKVTSARIVKEGELKNEKIKNEKIFQAKEKFIELKGLYEQEIKQRELKIREKEHKVNEELNYNNQQRKKLNALELENKTKQSLLEKKKEELDNLFHQQIEKLERLSNYTAQQAREELINSLKHEAKLKAQSQIQAIIEEANLNAKSEARKIIVQAIQRVGTEQAIENSVSVFNIDSDEIKGRIIGREGRNIRALEAITGVEIIVDDTPEAILLSCFDPVRREVARLSLHRLVTDGRIHPARIEEVVSKTSHQIEDEIIEIGKKTVLDLNIHGLHPELVKIVGRMKYRSSYGQNLLQHSREVSNIAGILAAELGLNVKLAKRAGLLHDIGKVPEQESELPHALLGMQWAEKYGENQTVCNAIGAHHDEIEMLTLLSPIVQVADAISGARPGARRQAVESYMKRLKDIENVALSFDGVTTAYAIQAGRELRVMVQSDKINDQKATELSFEISEKIQNELTYPGQVKITVIRETRSVAMAR